MSSRDRATEWDLNKAADRLFGPRGGMAVWVRSEEAAARAAARFTPPDIVANAIELAALEHGLAMLTRSIAQKLGCTEDQLRQAIAIAKEEAAKRVEHATRIRNAWETP